VRNIFLLLFILLLLVGCNEKQDSQDIPVENTIEFLGDEKPDASESNRFKIHKKDDIKIAKENTLKEKQKRQVKKHLPPVFSDVFTLKNFKNTTYSVTVSNEHVKFKEPTKDIVLVSFFATWCPPCVYQIPYYNDLQKKYTQDISIIGILIHDKISTSGLRSFMAKESIQYYLSISHQNNDFASLVAKTLHLPTHFSIPLTVMYLKGTYFTHYEGIVPIEMIEYDIAQAKKQSKQTK